MAVLSKNEDLTGKNEIKDTIYSNSSKSDSDMEKENKIREYIFKIIKIIILMIIKMMKK